MQSLVISAELAIPFDEISLTAVASQGAGGQNVNKVATAIHLRFDIRNSSLPEEIRDRLLALPDKRITRDGVVILKAQRFRSQEKNREDALRRLLELVSQGLKTEKTRRPTKPSRAAATKRLDSKTRRSQLKTLRSKITD